MFANHVPVRSPIEAASVLLTAAASVSKLELLSGLLIERAASYYLHANQTRKFLFHEVLCCLKIRGCGARPSAHAIVSAACALLIQDDLRYGGLKSKLALLLAGDIRINIPKSNPQYLLLTLKAAYFALCDERYVTGRSTTVESIANAVLNELLSESAEYRGLAVSEGWEQASTFEAIQNPYHVYDTEAVSRCVYII
jgi:hypothetical protein